MGEKGLGEMTEAPEPGLQRVEDIDPALLHLLLTLDDTEVIVPLRIKREDVHKVKAVKLSDEEVATVAQFQNYLHDRGYTPDNTFASLFCYVFNVAYTRHRLLAEEEARKEEESG